MNTSKTLLTNVRLAHVNKFITTSRIFYNIKLIDVVSSCQKRKIEKLNFKNCINAITKCVKDIIINKKGKFYYKNVATTLEIIVNLKYKYTQMILFLDVNMFDKNKC